MTRALYKIPASICALSCKNLLLQLRGEAGFMLYYAHADERSKVHLHRQRAQARYPRRKVRARGTLSERRGACAAIRREPPDHRAGAARAEAGRTSAVSRGIGLVPHVRRAQRHRGNRRDRPRLPQDRLLHRPLRRHRRLGPSLRLRRPARRRLGAGRKRTRALGARTREGTSYRARTR